MDFKAMVTVDEYDPENLFDITSVDTGDGSTKLFTTFRWFDPVRIDAPFFMGYGPEGLDLYDYLEATGVINPSELVEGREAGYVEPGNFQLVFGSEKGAHGFAERLNDLLHLRREKFLEFVFSSPSTKGGQ